MRAELSPVRSVPIPYCGIAPEASYWQLASHTRLHKAENVLIKGKCYTGRKLKASIPISEIKWNGRFQNPDAHFATRLAVNPATSMLRVAVEISTSTVANRFLPRFADIGARFVTPYRARELSFVKTRWNLTSLFLVKARHTRRVWNSAG